MNDNIDAFERVYEGIADALQKLSVPADFHIQMLNSDTDWAFVIKTHALIEAAITHLLITRLGEPALEDVLSRTDLSNLSTGRLAYAKALNLLPKKQITFVHALSTLRNSVVHDIRNVNFTFQNYFASFSPDQVKAKAGCLTVSPGDMVPSPSGNLPRHDIVVRYPRVSILHASICILAEIYFLKNKKQGTTMV